jgi:hypothetical protein
MQSGNEGNGNHLRRLRGRLARSRSIGTKLTPEEEKRIVAAAEADGKAPSEWAREVLLRTAIDEGREQIERHIFTELVGVQMLLMGTLEPLLCGERLTREEIAARFRQVQKSKAAQADELLSRRTQTREK